MKKVSIIGFGNILRGDLGFGCYIIDILGQEPLDDCTELTFLGENSHYTGAFIYGLEFAVIVGALDLGGCPGRVHCWTRETFQSHLPWLAEGPAWIDSLARALARIEFSGQSPRDVLFLWIEPEATEGFGISREIRKALRKTVAIIKDNLFQRGFLPQHNVNLSSIYQLKVLCTTI
jgi:hydrogenase maturation protease